MLIRAEKKITKEQYDHAQEHGGYIADEDMGDIFTLAERLGYGIYEPIARKTYNPITGEDSYFVTYTTGATCD